MVRAQLQGDSCARHLESQLRGYIWLYWEVGRLHSPDGIRACSPQQSPDLYGPCRKTGSEHTGLTHAAITPVSPLRLSKIGQQASRLIDQGGVLLVIKGGYDFSDSRAPRCPRQYCVGRETLSPQRIALPRLRRNPRTCPR